MNSNMSSKNKKKGFTLVEIMAAMAIFLILSLSIGNLLTSSAKIENKSNNRLENINYVKAVMDIFDVKRGDGTDNETISNDRFNYFLNNGVVTISFDNMDELEKKILGTYTGTDGTTYSAIIKVSNKESNIYKVEATVKDNEKGNEVDKKIYISR
ncbi:Hypothetial membrane protein [Clostridium bornimense]|uniref:Hypothetial membrane protein n=1 Tax=Clostridium bornimense TaxID=1216932 RepID=W6RVW7_9CLOT|nr:type II secretion system protein [Clostridium bornimense]CDM68493.1 Hypothetial membrane protein [Clostridium bornimense]